MTMQMTTKNNFKMQKCFTARVVANVCLAVVTKNINLNLGPDIVTAAYGE